MSLVDIPFDISENLLGILKLVVMFCLLLYLAFSILVLRQTQLMTKTVTGKLDKFIHLVSWGYFGMTILVFLASMIFL